MATESARGSQRTSGCSVIRGAVVSYLEPALGGGNQISAQLHRANATVNCSSGVMARNNVSSLPLSLAPRVQAAEYIGVGATKFDEMVDDGRMPRPKRIDGRCVWDRIKLDEAFAALEDEAGQKNEWDAL